MTPKHAELKCGRKRLQLENDIGIVRNVRYLAVRQERCNEAVLKKPQAITLQRARFAIQQL